MGFGSDASDGSMSPTSSSEMEMEVGLRASVGKTVPAPLVKSESYAVLRNAGTFALGIIKSIGKKLKSSFSSRIDAILKKFKLNNKKVISRFIKSVVADAIRDQFGHKLDGLSKQAADTAVDIGIEAGISLFEKMADVIGQAAGI